MAAAPGTAEDPEVSVYLALVLIAGVLGAVGVAQSDGHNPAAWGVLLVALALALGRVG